jgi:hypothetical protein
MYPDPMVPLLEKVRAYEEAITEIKGWAQRGAAEGDYAYFLILDVIDELEKKLG